MANQKPERVTMGDMLRAFAVEHELVIVELTIEEGDDSEYQPITNRFDLYAEVADLMVERSDWHGSDWHGERHG